MQKLNCTELGEKLSNSLDDENRIKDLGIVQDIFTTLERANITKEVLEKSRLGRHVNEFRRKTKDEALAKRAKDLVRRWRDLLLPSQTSQNSNVRTSQTQVPPPSPLPSTATGATTIPMAISTTAQTLSLSSSSSISRSSSFKPHSPAAGIITKPPQSPANFAMTRNHMPHSPLIRDATSLPYKALSPALSTLHSNRSRSPNLSSQQQSTNYPVNHQLNSSSSPVLLSTGTNQHHNLEAVPRTHSSNKRLRKEDTTTTTTTTLNQQQLGTPLRDDQPLFKKQRINGENINSNTNITNINKINSQVPSPLSTPKVIHNNDDFKSSGGGGGGGDNNIVVVATSTTSTTSVVIPPPATATVDVGPKKRGRKKGSKVIKNQLQPDVAVGVKEKLQSMSRDSKCKTTQELMEDLKAARGSSTKLSLDYTLSNVKIKNEPPTTKEILRNSSSNDVKYNSSGRTTTTTTTTPHRLSSKLTKSSGDDDDDDDDDDEEDDEDDDNNNNNNNKINNDGGKKNNSSLKNTTQFRHDPTVEEILAKLPPLDLNSIHWSDNELDDHDNDDDDDDDDDRRPPPPPPTDEEIERLHEYSIECLNGNFQARLDNLSNNVDKNGDGLTSYQTMKYPLFRKRNNKNSNSNNDDVDVGVGVGVGDGDVDKFDKNNHYEFREWHEMLARPTIDGQILHILPYVIID